MAAPSLGSMLLSSTNPERLRDWYVNAFSVKSERTAGEPAYDVLDFDGFYVMLDRRADIGALNPEPGRLILNLEVSGARDIVARLDELGTKWHSPLEDRDGSLFATAIDPDGNYVQLVDLSDEAKAAMT
jgi:predicted enzyme related to lactoylglutathione lyase